MSKNKVIICTVLFTIVLFGVLFGTACLGDGIVYRYIIGILAGLKCGDIINCFSNWIRKNN